MRNCPYCGVELEENANFCSLCGEPLLDKNKETLAFIHTRKQQQEEKLLTDYQKLNSSQKRKIFWKISGMALLAGIIITTIIDLLANESISWSKYPVTVSVLLYLNITLITFWLRRPYLLYFFSFLSSSGFLILLDVFAGDTGWGMRLGIPLLLAVYITLYVLLRLITATRQKGLNIIAYSLIAAGLFSVSIDGIISLYANESLRFSWSLIVLASSVPISLLFLYVHYKLKKVTDLKRFFHL